MSEHYLYITIIRNEKSNTFFYNIVDPEDQKDVENYIQAFNEMSNHAKEEQGLNKHWTQILFELSEKKLNLLEYESAVDDFYKFVNDNDYVDITPFVLGFTKHIVDDIFRMDEIRSDIPYNNWVQCVFYFISNAGDTVVADLGLNALDDSIDIIKDILQAIVDRHRGRIILENENHEKYIYTNDDFRTHFQNLDDYDKPPTSLNFDFWDLILDEASPIERFNLLRVDNREIQDIVLEFDRKSRPISEKVFGSFRGFR